jgi:hypothetical protein
MSIITPAVQCLADIVHRNLNGTQLLIVSVPKETKEKVVLKVSSMLQRDGELDSFGRAGIKWVLVKDLSSPHNFVMTTDSAFDNETARKMTAHLIAEIKDVTQQHDIDYIIASKS